jgi:hypothetical protein
MKLVLQDDEVFPRSRAWWRNIYARATCIAPIDHIQVREEDAVHIATMSFPTNIPPQQKVLGIPVTYGNTFEIYFK